MYTDDKNSGFCFQKSIIISTGNILVINLLSSIMLCLAFYLSIYLFSFFSYYEPGVVQNRKINEKKESMAYILFKKKSDSTVSSSYSCNWKNSSTLLEKNPHNWYRKKLPSHPLYMLVFKRWWNAFIHL